MDAFTRAVKLPPNAYQYGENIIVEDNFLARTRPGADKFVNNTFSGKIQGVFYFDTPNLEQLIFGNSGAIFTADSTGAYSAGTGALANSDVDFVAAQGVDKVLLVDGTSCFVMDGSSTTAFSQASGATGFDPPFTATTVVFCAGRMWAAGFPGSGTAGKEDDSVCFSALLDFGTGKWNLTDQAFRVGGGEGDPIRGLASLPASVPEQEVLVVLKENSIRIIRVDPVQSDSSGFKATLLPETVAGGVGVVGKRAFAVVGNDLFYVSPDRTFRSLARMEAAAGQYQIDPLPLSTPLKPYVDRINWAQASKIAVVRYKQLALFSVPLDSNTTPNTVFVWNGRLQAWVGLFTGWTPNSWAVTRFNGVQNLVFGDNGGLVRKWKDTSDQTDDNTYLDDSVAISWKLWTRSFLFGEPLNNKDMYAMTGHASTSNAIANLTLNCDGVDVFQWTKNLQPPGPNLPIDLPFDLTSPSNTKMPRGLRGNVPFNECFLKIEGTSGFASFINFYLSAFLNTIDMDT